MVNAEDELLLQRKDEEWGGEFVDIAEGEQVPDRSVIKVTQLYSCSINLYIYTFFFLIVNWWEELLKLIINSKWISKESLVGHATVALEKRCVPSTMY